MIPTSIYKGFSKWWSSNRRYTHFLKIFVPENDDKLKSNQDFLDYLKVSNASDSLLNSLGINPVSVRGGTLTVGGETDSPWEQIGMTEREFAKKYPAQYRQVLDFAEQQATTTPETTPTTDTKTIYGYADEELSQMSAQLGITVDEL